MENSFTRLPADFKFEEGKSYSVKYKRSEWKYIYEPNVEMYRREEYALKKLKYTAYTIPKDVPNSMDYALSFADGKGVITEI